MEELFSESKKKSKKKEWKFGKKHDIRGTTDAALKHHPEKFSKDACKKGGDSDKLCPYAVFTNMAKKKKVKSTYKDKSTTDKKKPVKKTKAKKKKKNIGESFVQYITKRNPKVFSEWNNKEKFYIDLEAGVYIASHLADGTQKIIGRDNDANVLERRIKNKYPSSKVIHIYQAAVDRATERDKQAAIAAGPPNVAHRGWGPTESVNYEFSDGERVEHLDGRQGTVSSCVPGNGIGWYFVDWDDGTQDRHTADELRREKEKVPRRFRY